MRTELPATRPLLLLGSSGSVGQAVARALCQNGRFGPVLALVRRSQPALVQAAQAAGLHWREFLVPDMVPAKLRQATHQAAAGLHGQRAAVAIHVLGVGAGTAQLSLAAHRAVDVELTRAFAQGLKDAGTVLHLAFMTAVGANARAATGGSGAAGMPRYNRVKGEAEQAAAAAGLSVLSIFRPAMILGSQHTPGWLQKTLPAISFLLPGKFRPIAADTIAAAMLATLQDPAARSRIYHGPDMRERLQRTSGTP